MQLWCTPFPIWNQSVDPCPVLLLLFDLHTDFSGARSVGLIFPSLEEFSVACDPYSQRLWHSQLSRSRCFSGALLLLDDPMDVGNLISGFFAFLNPAWTSGSSWFMYCWSLAWRILSITLLAWGSQGKNTEVVCHSLLQCMKVKSESEVAQSCLTQRPHGLQPTRLPRPWIFQARGLESGATAFSVLQPSKLQSFFSRLETLSRAPRPTNLPSSRRNS